MTITVPKTLLLGCSFIAAPMISWAAPTPAVISGDQLNVAVDTSFPRIIAYQSKAANATLDAAQIDTKPAIKVNGREANASIRYSAGRKGSGNWRVEIPDLGITFTVTAKIDGSAFSMRVTDIVESKEPMRTLEFTNAPLVRVHGSKDARMVQMRVGEIKEKADTAYAVAERNPDSSPDGVTYAFASEGKLAAGFLTSVIDEDKRLLVQTTKDADGNVTEVSSGSWLWRFIDEKTKCNATTEQPWVVVAVSPDCNGDAVADWQDAAVALRKAYPGPMGGDKVKDQVVCQIPMNFASQAQNPFLATLDDIKATWLVTDGLGQDIQFKGYQSEGHDSAHPDYAGNVGVHQGGLGAFKYVLRRMKDFNARGGVHINATESYPEAHAFSDELVANRRSGGWAWIDNSWKIDMVRDAASGDLAKRLADMRKELPDLEWVYLDVYMEKGWIQWYIANEMRKNKLPFGTEYSSFIERQTFWVHHRNAKSRMLRFLRNHDRDIWANDPILRGARQLGHLGWASETSVNNFVNNIFEANLPSKYLQRQPLMRWTDKEAVFADGSKAVRENNGTFFYTPEGTCVAKLQDGDRYLLPWDANRLFHWNARGGETTWDLPKGWNDVSELHCYTLTIDQGRTDHKVLPVKDGKVTVQAKGRTPYVLYRKAAPVMPADMKWGEGTPVANPGFHGNMAGWTPVAKDGAKASIDILDTGDRVLLLDGPGSAEARQTLSNLKPGAWYSASVFVEIEGERPASLELRMDGTKLANGIVRSEVENFQDSHSKYRKRYQPLKLRFKAPAKGGVELALTAGTPAKEGSKVRFDQVRVMPVAGPANPCREDFENVDFYWGPFVYGLKGDTKVHLSEAHAPYTNDTISGKWSLKIRDEREGLVVRTLPQLLPLAKGKRYKVAFDYLNDNAAQYSFVHGSRTAEAGRTPLPKGKFEKARFETTIEAGEDAWIGFHKKDGNGGTLVIDNLSVDPL